MMRRWLLAILLIGCTAVTGIASAQQLDLAPISPINGDIPQGTTAAAPLSVTITKSLYLPPQMYGHWSVTGTLTETNADWFFNPVVHDIWILDRENDQVTISNPVTGATASVNVDKVDGNTATFHRMVVSKTNKVFFEMPTITVDGDRMTGTTINKYQHLNDGRIDKSYYARYRLEAHRISPSRLKFRDGNAPVNFEIEDIRTPSGP